MIDFILNIFRKNKICTFYPDHSCSGSGVAIEEFFRHKEVLEGSSERKVRMVRTYSIFGFERIKYVIEE